MISGRHAGRQQFRRHRAVPTHSERPCVVRALRQNPAGSGARSLLTKMARWLRSLLSIRRSTLTLAVIAVVTALFAGEVTVLDQFELRTYDLRFRARERGTEAEVDAEAEGDVPVLLARDVQHVRVGELRGIAVRRRERARRDLPLVYRVAVDLDVLD